MYGSLSCWQASCFRLALNISFFIILFFFPQFCAGSVGRNFGLSIHHTCGLWTINKKKQKKNTDPLMWSTQVWFKKTMREKQILKVYRIILAQESWFFCIRKWISKNVIFSRGQVCILQCFSHVHATHFPCSTMGNNSSYNALPCSSFFTMLLSIMLLYILLLFYNGIPQ